MRQRRSVAMMSKWEFYSPAVPELLTEMMREYHIPRPVARVLYNRGFTAANEVTGFLNPSTELLHDPFLMKDMERAVERIIVALREAEPILIYGDYDVDGITSVSLLYLFLKDLSGNVSYYIPNRAAEGYGISSAGIAEAVKRNCALIISVDCGITSVEEVGSANAHGIDVIVTDHHEPGPSLPPAYAIINPKRPDCPYPFKELAGVGVAFKLAQGIVKKLELKSSFAENYLDLVAIGSAADIVPLVEENRVFVKIGLDKLNKDGLEGLVTLIETAGFQAGHVDVGQIVYGIAPRINAVGRLGHALPAVELLVTRNHRQAVQIAGVLEEENRRRKEIDQKTLNEALQKIEEEYDPERDVTIVLAAEDWHPGVIGIVASRIIEKYYRPTVMITIDQGVGKGSARSIPNFDLHSALKSCSDLFLQFGGHKYAAGLTIEAGKIPEFRAEFNRVAKAILTDDDLIPKVKIDDDITLDAIDRELVRMLALLAPFGPRNSRPSFVTYQAQLVGDARIVGNNHLKFRVKQNGATFEAIAFNRGNDLGTLQERGEVDMVYNIEENVYLDKSRLQLKIKDMRFGEE